MKMPKKILLVDDKKDICETVKDILVEGGYKVDTALSGKEALVKLRKEKPDLVLIDFFMPGMSGLELLEKIRKEKELKNSRCAFLTAVALSRKEMAMLEELEALDCIKKPFDNADFLKRINKVVK